jgi:hypothetical protein
MASALVRIPPSTDRIVFAGLAGAGKLVGWVCDFAANAVARAKMQMEVNFKQVPSLAAHTFSGWAPPVLFALLVFHRRYCFADPANFYCYSRCKSNSYPVAWRFGAI